MVWESDYLNSIVQALVRTIPLVGSPNGDGVMVEVWATGRCHMVR
jgi:hypothetical protein